MGRTDCHSRLGRVCICRHGVPHIQRVRVGQTALLREVRHLRSDLTRAFRVCAEGRRFVTKTEIKGRETKANDEALEGNRGRFQQEGRRSSHPGTGGHYQMHALPLS